MTCPMCGGVTFINQKYTDVDSVRRKRICKECGHIFYTLEVDEDLVKPKEKPKKSVMYDVTMAYWNSRNGKG